MTSLTEDLKSKIRTVPDFPEPGIQFRDITPVLEDPGLSRRILDRFLEAFSGTHIDAVMGIESRGFIFGMPLALRLGVPFLVVRKKGKLPADTVSHSYELEYGTETIELHRDAVKEDQHILLHDDLLATGGTARAASELIRKEGGVVAGYGFVIELTDLKGAEKLNEHAQNIVKLVSY